MFRLFLISILCLGLGTFGMASPTAPYQMISELGTSAETISLGNIEGFSRSSSGVFENPAALYRVRKYATTFFTSEIMSESRFTLFSAAYRIKYGVIGVGYMASDISGISNTAAPADENSLPTVVSVFSEGRKIMKLSYMYSWDRSLHLGSSLNYYSTDLFTFKADSFDVDLGAIYKYKLWTFSAQVKNAMKRNIGYERSDDPGFFAQEYLPRWYVFGAQYRFRQWRVMGQLLKRPHHNLVSFATRYTPSFFDSMSFQMGYQQQAVLFDVKPTVAFGVLIHLHGFNIAYAFQKSDHPEFDNYTYLSLHLDY